MDRKNIKEEMQSIIKKCVSDYSENMLNQCLDVYEKTFGKDEFYSEIINKIMIDVLQVSLICIEVSDEYINEFLAEQTYSNIEIVKVDSRDSYQDIYEYILTTNSSYVCFLEPDQKHSSRKIEEMVKYIYNNDVDIVIAGRNFIDQMGTVIAHSFSIGQNGTDKNYLSGKSLFEYCVRENVNIYGSLSNILVSADYIRMHKLDMPQYQDMQISKMVFLSQLILRGTIGYMNEPLVSVVLSNWKEEGEQQKYYYKYIDYLRNKGEISLPGNWQGEIETKNLEQIQKHITFFYTDKGEYYNLKPIADEAEHRGFTTEFTSNLKQKAEIGIYCQHFCYPENSKFSLILLHDMAQGHNRWPNIWEIEKWNKFDIGIVPGEEWARRWSQCAFYPFANPRLGTFQLGYPKSDLIDSPELIQRTEELRKQFNFKYKFSVLYAPSWENDEKEDDFIRALASLPMNLLVKQAHWPEQYSNIIKNIEDMRILHEGKYENVYYIEPEESIMTALKLCDMVVSDESSVMAEAIMFNKPSLAVIDWLIPDTKPSRFASVPMEYVCKCKKVELREYVEKFYSQPDFYISMQKKFNHIFSNQGNCCKDILDAVEYYTQSKEEYGFMDKKLNSQYTSCNMWS